MNEYKIGDRVIHHGHITEVVGVSVKYMLCGGARVYAHDLKPATDKSHEVKTCATHGHDFSRPDGTCSRCWCKP